MGDEDNRTEFIKLNSKVLSTSTSIGAEFVLGLFEKELIGQEEMEQLNSPGMLNIQKAMLVYTKIANKWNQSQFEGFKQVLQDTGNLLALQVFTNAGADVFLTNEQVQLIRQQIDRSTVGCYEGLSYEDELAANQIVQCAKYSEMFKDGKLKLSGDIYRRDVIQHVRKFAESLQNEAIWWNPKKSSIPKNYIPRRLCRGSHYSRAFSYNPELIELMGEKTVLVVDSPGMGKSSEVTVLEDKLRKNLPTNRIIIRINLNEVQSKLSAISESESALNVLLTLAPFVSSKTIQMDDVSVFVLLDGLDEVCPKYTDTMLSLLRTLRSSEKPSDLHVVVTTRPHLRETLESEFKLKSWSLLPLNVEEQDGYMRLMGVFSEQITIIRSTLTQSIRFLLDNPLMLSMLVDVLKSGGTLLATDINIYDLYTRFVEAKHQLYCVEKLRMEPESNNTDIQRESMLNRNLRFYYFIALDRLTTRHLKLSKEFIESIGRVSTDPHEVANGSNITTELLSYGLLIEDQDKRLVFKHWSFAEFFYARLLTQEESTSQVVRDTLFGLIYGSMGVLEHVEDFVEAALSKKKKRDKNNLIQITTKWIFCEKEFYGDCHRVRKFVDGKLFHLCASEVFMTFVEGEPGDLWNAVKILLDSWFRETFIKLFEWMNKNIEWTRNRLLKISEVTKIYPAHLANLMVAIAVRFEDQVLFSDKEVGVALSCCDRLIYIVASVQRNEECKQGKWAFVEDRLGESEIKKAMQNMNDDDFPRVIEDLETAWKLVSTLSLGELYTLVSNEETRVTDAVGRNPRKVSAVLGKNFIAGLIDFRAKFGDDKGKTIFELSYESRQYALDFLWEDLLKAKDHSNSRGNLVMTLREAIGMSPTGIVHEIRNQLRKRRKCPRDPTCNFLRRNNKECEQLLEWILEGNFQWDVQQWRNLLQEYGHKPIPESLVIVALRSFIYAVTCKNEEFSTFFSELTAVLQGNLEKNIPKRMKSLTQVFLGAKREDIMKAAPTHNCKCLPLYDASLGQVFIRLVQPFGITDDDASWKAVVCDLIQFTPCCDIPAVFHELKVKFRNTFLLREVLKRKIVLAMWTRRYSLRRRTKCEKSEVWDLCGLKNMLSFYFTVFGFNFHWMTNVSGNEEIVDGWNLLHSLPVEIITVFETNQQWIYYLLPQFLQLMEMSCLHKVHSVREFLVSFPYRTEWDWEKLMQFVGGGGRIHPGSPIEGHIESSKAAPFIRVLMRMFGIEGAKAKVKHLWKNIPAYIHFQCDTPDTLGSLLHSAIELGVLKEVQRRAYPGLLLVMNPQGKTALQISDEKFDQQHPIRVHLHKICSSRKSSHRVICSRN